MKELRTLNDVSALSVSKERIFLSARHEEILAGATTDIYFVRSLEILCAAVKIITEVTADIFAGRGGV